MNRAAKTKIVFMGTPQIAVPILQSLLETPDFEIILVICEPDKTSGRGNQFIPSAIKDYAQKHRLDILQPEKIVQIKSKLIKLKPNLAVVTAYGQIIPKEIIDIFKHGIINVHFSLLPSWRGASPIQSTILAGDKTTGTSLMLIDEKMDTGPILAQKKVPVLSDDNFLTLSQKLTAISANILPKTLLGYLSGKIKPTPQNHKLATYCQMIKKEAGLLDFTKPAITLEREIRSYVNWPKSYSFWDKKRLIIKNAKAIPNIPEPPASAGTVFLDQHLKLPAVLAGTGSLLLLELQLEGKKPQTGTEFMNGYPDFIGSILKNN
ncbi:MAG TPA: methionyl-tRNA formyltransferase [Patescibacteria group bacterium]|nr:methionyl-tRNA formyltransferase [Patescibacteria group bacterium]